MDISWLHYLNVNVEALVTQSQTSLKSIESLLSVSVKSQLTLSSLVLLAYLFIAVLTKRSSFLMAFFVSWVLFECSAFDYLSEASLYLITFAMYSYVITCKALTFKQRIACGILLTLSIILAYDAYFYGIDGIYGAHETMVYNHIEHLALCSHAVFIGTLIPYRRIKDGFRCFLSSFLHQQGNSAYMLFSV